VGAFLVIASWRLLTTGALTTVFVIWFFIFLQNITKARDPYLHGF
jgi:hypothetical protein